MSRSRTRLSAEAQTLDRGRTDLVSHVHLLLAVLSLQSADSTSAYADPQVEALLDRARLARGSEAAGLSNYEATVRERIHLGLSGFRFRRLRSLYRSERVARVRWDRDGGETLRWLGIRKEVPVVGAAAEIDIDELEDLEVFPIDPTGDRLKLAGSPFLHPLADTAAAHYRYASGDTIRIRLSTGQTITLVEVRLEPRRSDFALLAGSLWFDLQTSALVRAAYRPARPLDLELDDPDEASEVPGFLKPMLVDVELITIDYALRELEWWLPHRIRLEGMARAGNLIRFPITIEASADDFEVNQSGGLNRDAEPPEGWVRYEVENEDEEEEDATPRIVFRPPDSVLVDSPVLSDVAADPSPIAFTKADLSSIRARLRALALPDRPRPASRLRWGLPRYNRIEALSLGAEWRIPLSGEDNLLVRGRLGAADVVPGGEVELTQTRRSGSLTVSAYHRLAAADDWGDALGFGNSMNALTLGYDDGQYYRASGMSLALKRESGAVRGSGRLYAERHRSAQRETDVSLANAIGSDGFGPNIDADELDLVGLQGRIRTQAGLDPERVIVSLDAWAEVAFGDATFQRLAGTVSLTSPVGSAFGVSAEVGAGTTWSETPVQRLYYLGGPTSLRGFRNGQVSGQSFWLGRLELATRRPAVRFLAFTDLAWAGDRSRFGTEGTAMSVGAGVSGLDGLIRVDLARGIMGPDPLRWRLHAYLDALF